MSSEEAQLRAIKEAVLKRTTTATVSEDDTPRTDSSKDTTEPVIVSVPEVAERSLLKTEVAGYDFNRGINYSELLKSYLTSGFQATNFGLAVEQIEQMVSEILVYILIN